ncbi:hypothetical protein [Amycolatopsis sp.]|uniref:hypothetical protein n=1 Tax=Amycolatopsis sp. TaxID=37632 RepID=UPI002CE97D55|nr:hypothetical protein [Amycolatopsis sp.]HVV12617.1 hypothetical protein [Amycolatopsis sp.]
MIRRLVLVFLGGAAVVLVPWIVYLAHTLPDRYDTGQWRTAWVGFDVALMACFAGAAWLGLRRRRAAVPLLAATAALLCCDAWFDVLLDWGSSDRWTSVGLAVFAELPLAVFLLLAARRLLTGDLRRRVVTLRDIELAGDARYQELMRELPATTAELAARTGRAETEIQRCLETLAAAGFARRRNARWRALPVDLREPSPAEYTGPQRARVTKYLEDKYARELKLLSWAADHRDEFGPWGKASRAAARLTDAELRAFEAEYMELLARYCGRRPAPGAREVAVRFYAFPRPVVTAATEP